MEFVRQEYFWLLLAIPLLILFWGLGVRHLHRMRARFGNIENLEATSRISWSGRAWLRGMTFLISATLMILGLAYPRTISRELRPVPTPTDLIFLLDVSPSMYAKDHDPNRMAKAQEIIQKFILRKQQPDRYALITFNYTSVVLNYLTGDPQSIVVYFDYLNHVEEPEVGSNFGAALTNSLRLIATDAKANPERAKGRRRVIVLISDGDDNIGEWAAPLHAVVNAGVKVYTFGIGTASGGYVPLVISAGQPVKYLVDEEGYRIVSHAQSKTMRDIAEKTGGQFFRGENNRQVDQAIEEILYRGRPIAGYQANPIRKDLYEEFLMTAFAFLILGIFL